MKRRLAIPVLALILGLTALSQAPAGARAVLAAPPATTRCGLSWSIVPTGFRSGSFPGASLHDVDAASATEAFAVGWKDPDTSLVLRWNGTAWRRETLPPIKGRHQLKGVVALGGGEAWAVGWSNRSSTFKTLVLHRSNGAWARVPSPSPNATYNVLEAVDGASANDLWAVGSDGDAVLTVHWDGVAWTKVPFPSPGTQDRAADVEAVSSDNVWIVGHTDPGSDVSLRGHWDGTAWSGAAVSSYGALDGIDAASASDIWAVGDDSTANGNSGLIHHFNGTRWKQVSGAAPGVYGDWYREVVASQEVGIWAVGGYSAFGSYLDAQLWNGSTWTSIPLPYTGTSDQELASIDAGGGHLWATGTNRSKTSSIMLELCPLRLTGAGLSTIASTSALGRTAVFLVPGSETASHSIADDGPLGLFDVGPIAPGGFGTHRFAVAGGYAVRDATTDAAGTIGVAPLANPSVGASGDRFTVTWAKGPVDGGLVFDVQVLRPGAASFRAWRTGVEGTSARFLPDGGTGWYLFRARARSVAGELWWSPTVAIRVT